MKHVHLFCLILFAALCAIAAPSFFSEPTYLAILNRKSTETSLTNGLVAYWKFDNSQGPGGTHIDSSDNDYYLTPIGGFQTQAGLVGEAQMCQDPDTTTMYCYTNNFLHTMWTNNWSVVGWYNRYRDALDAGSLPTSDTGITIGTNEIQNACFALAFNLEQGGPKVFFRQFGATNQIYAMPEIVEPPVSNWTHYALIKSASGFFCYSNNVLVASTNSGVNADTNFANQIFITQDMVGLVDEVAIYNRVLTAGELAKIYNNGTNGVILTTP